jgi:hypothetical protein
MQKVIKFRPHHFMCTLGFRGKGYSGDFIKNYKKIVQTLNEDENTLIEVVKYMDDICFTCPNKIDETICKTQNRITKLDAAHSAALHLVPGEILSWKQAKNRIKKYMNVEKFLQSCNGCPWQKYGICQESLEQLIMH